MTRFVARVISKGRVTIPEEIRALEEIEVGDYVELELKQVKRKEGKKEEAEP